MFMRKPSRVCAPACNRPETVRCQAAIEGTVAELLFDIIHNLSFNCCSEGITAFRNFIMYSARSRLAKSTGTIACGRAALVDRHGVGDALTKIYDDAS